jgi:hypothetical protein
VVRKNERKQLIIDDEVSYAGSKVQFYAKGKILFLGCQIFGDTAQYKNQNKTGYCSIYKLA